MKTTRARAFVLACSFALVACGSRSGSAHNAGEIELGTSQGATAAAFFPAPPTACIVMDAGVCRARACNPAIGATTMPPAYVDAGPIAIADGASVVTLTPDASHTYPIFHSANDSWMGGDRLAIAAVGGAVPAFSGALVVPRVLRIATPPLPTTIARDTDLAFTWQATPDEVDVVLAASVDSTEFDVQCRFDGGGGAAVVPASVLSLLPVGPGTIGVTTARAATIHAGDWDVAVSADAPSFDSEGAPYRGALTFE